MKSIIRKISLLLAVMAMTTGVFAQTTGKITVSPTSLQNGSDDDKWIPLFVQGQLTSDIQNYSDFEVIDRMAATQLAGEQRVMETAAAINNDDVSIQYAEAVAVDYTVIVSLLKKGESYAFDAKVMSVANSKAIGKAFSKPNVYEEELSDGSIIHQAAYELLKGMGVDETRLADLKKQTDEQKNSVEAQISLSKGIVAEQSGQNLEAMTYYLKASGSDKKLKEAAKRLSSTSVRVSSGNFGVDAENKIAFRNQWVELLNQTVKTLEKEPPFVYVYSGQVEPLELTAEDYDNSTQSFAMKGNLYFTDEWDVISNFKQSLESIPESKNWGKAVTNFPTANAQKDSWINRGYVNVTISLRDANKKILKSTVQAFVVDYDSILQSGRNSRSYDCIFSAVPIANIKNTDTLIISVDDVSFTPYYDKNTKTSWKISIVTEADVIKNNPIEIVEYNSVWGKTIATSPVKRWIAELNPTLNTLFSHYGTSYKNTEFDSNAELEINGVVFRTLNENPNILVKEGEPCFTGVVIQNSGNEYVIKSVIEGSPAQKAGIQAGDVLLDYPNSRMSTKSFLAYLADDSSRSRYYYNAYTFASGDIVNIPIKRGDQELIAHIQLVSKEEGNKIVNASLESDAEYKKVLDQKLQSYSSSRQLTLGITLNFTGWNYDIVDIDPNGPAANSGIQKGDSLYNIKPGWGPIGITEDMIKEQLRSMKAGEVLTLYCKRKNKKMEFPITVGYPITAENKLKAIKDAQRSYFYSLGTLF